MTFLNDDVRDKGRGGWQGVRRIYRPYVVFSALCAALMMSFASDTPCCHTYLHMLTVGLTSKPCQPPHQPPPSPFVQ